MSGGEPTESEEIKKRILEQACTGNIRFTLHAHQGIVAEDFSLEDVRAGLTNGQMIEITRNINAALAHY